MTCKNKPCATCGAEFTPTGRGARYCPACADKSYRSCLSCGLGFWPDQPCRKYCSQVCAQKGSCKGIFSEDGLSKKCKVCEEFVPLEAFRRNGRYDSARNICRNCESRKSSEFFTSEEGRAYRRQWQTNERRTNPCIGMLRAAKKRAKEQKVPFDITVEDIVIPEFCPALKIALVCNEGVARDNSPTLDKIVPELGYVKGNIAVISKRANSIKNNAAEAELRAIADWLHTVGENK